MASDLPEFRNVSENAPEQAQPQLDMEMIINNVSKDEKAIDYIPVTAEILDAIEPTAGEIIKNTNQDIIVEAAESMLGKPYISCGSTEAGVDCSGLVVYCYNLIGIALPHNSVSLCSVGEEVEPDDIKPGDIVCWDNYGSGVCGHVGLYVGDGQCIEARGHRWGVVYCDLDRSPIITIRRVLSSEEV